MQNSVIHIVKDLEGADQLESHLSFRGFVNFLKERRLYEKTMKSRYLDFLIDHFGHRLRDKSWIEPEEMTHYGDLLELMYSCIFPVIGDEKTSLWALAVPMTPTFVYGTDAFYAALWDPVKQKVKASMVDNSQKERRKLNLELVYSLILERLYGISFHPASSIIRSWVNESTGVANFYKLNIDLRFIEVFPKGPLPDVDPKFFQSHLTTPEILAWLTEHIPLSNFRFEGISAVTVTDVTTHYVLESIKNIILNPCHHCNYDSDHDSVIRLLKILSGSSEVNIGLLPFLQVNGKLVFSDRSCSYSVLAQTAEKDLPQQDKYLDLIKDYFKNPRLILYESLTNREEGEPFYLEPLRAGGVKAFGLIPVYYNNGPAGVLEVSSRSEGIVDHVLLTRLDVALPLLAQLLQQSIDQFDDRIKTIVKDNFTSIQPAVEWKFHEAAWHYEQMRELAEYPPVVETIYFKEVYPLYGAVDIRNSTIERNIALRKDLQTQFDILAGTVASLQEKVNLQLLEEMSYQAGKWRQALAGALTTADEINLNVFLKDRLGAFLEHFKGSRPDMKELINPYLEAIDEEKGIAFENRRNLEMSIQLVNKTINRQLELAEEEIQKSYPSYFEKFRTDGVEYDIYIGQAIAPDRPFDLLYLRNLRLWQLHSMTTIARLTHELIHQMPEPLETTQLIFVHSASIDISFRKDERRFDVEGGYNIRYQVVKKRIDKVHVLDTGERLTQPGKIAIIYFNDREAEEYRGYIRYLQEKDLLNEVVEELALEELQGVSGLRALRVGVQF